MLETTGGGEILPYVYWPFVFRLLRIVCSFEIVYNMYISTYIWHKSRSESVLGYIEEEKVRKKEWWEDAFVVYIKVGRFSLLIIKDLY